MFRSQVIRGENKGLNASVFIDEDSKSPTDGDLFVIDPPPMIRPSGQERFVASRYGVCKTCESVLGYLGYYAEQLVLGKKAMERLKLPAAAVHHPSLRSFKEGFLSGCHLCVLLGYYIRAPENEEEHEGVLIEMCWASEQTLSYGLGEVRVSFAVTDSRQERSRANYFNFLRLQLWPAEQFPNMLDLPTQVPDLNDEGLPIGVPGISTGSLTSQKLASEWLARCERNEDGKHDQCNKRGAAYVPRRLLDAQSAMTTSVLRLVSQGQQADVFSTGERYLTLSHCWGSWGPSGLPVLKSENFDERHEQGLRLDQLPQAFLDALEVAKWLGVRWLWIDSLCIIQNSPQDWRHEASKMSQVYQNAILNISAVDAVDAREGCFRSRHPLVATPLMLRLPVLDQTWWATIDERNMFDWVKNSPISQRAWIFQERQLARRILYFTGREMVWECWAQDQPFASETFPEGVPVANRFMGHTTLPIRVNVGEVQAEQENIYSMWNTLVETYSTKKLTKHTDRLVAIAGVASQVQDQVPSDSYVVGFWRSKLPQSLLWTVRGQDSDLVGELEIVRPEPNVAPTWSWASVSRPIKWFKKKRGDPVAAIADIQLDSESSNPTEQTAMTVKGYVRRVKLWQGDVEREGILEFERRERKLTIEDGGKSVTASEYRDSFYVTVDTARSWTTLQASCLFIDFRKPEGKRTDFNFDLESKACINGLLLEPTDAAGTFRRIGTLSVEGSYTVAMKYRLTPDCHDPTAAWRELEEAFEQAWRAPRSRSKERHLSIESEEWLMENESENELYESDKGDKSVAVEATQRAEMDGPAKLYADDPEHDESCFERLVPQTLRLI
ncbi:hypothetical protein MMC30_003673 [Trapelia coarctata]|nr:hypothetical protein [Trapelia coarctata]